MCKLNIIKLTCAVIVALLCAGNASAFDVSNYATQSRLATGKWVKISIPESGIYEITYNELRDMGFSNPANVRLYGRGGYRISELLDGRNFDDLLPVPVKRINNKMIFYGKGTINFTMTGYNNIPRFQRDYNPYALEGCYFLTEETSTELQVGTKNQNILFEYVNAPSSFGYYYHENELVYVANSGKDMMGEDFTSGRILIDYNLPDLSDSTIAITQSIGAKDSIKSYANAVIHSGGAADTTNFLTSVSAISAISETSTEFYRSATPYGSLKLSHPAQQGQYEPYLKFDNATHSLALARLDYFIFTYRHLNILRPENGNQVLMGFAAASGKERYQLPNASATTQLWYVYYPDNPYQVALQSYDDDSGKGFAFFAGANRYSYYIAFDPAKTLKKISSFEPVPNQNLHGMATPELLIITDKLYHEQAERVAQMHRSIDGIDVAVVDQDQIFNEFSSGTRDAMAYRLFCKMLYDRDPSKFKHLLLFGTGSLDNREIMGKHEGFLLTYQSDNSNDDVKSYTCDDFFGYLNDNSGSNMLAEKMNITVGRIPCGSLEQARSDVDKLIEYYANPDYGVWRNNTLVFSDSPDNGQYIYHGEGYRMLIDNELSTGMHVNTVHNIQYARSNEQPNVQYDRKIATVAKELLKRNFESGMYFATYVGHAGTTGFTKYNQMWVTSDVAGTSYKHFPIMSTACCDVSRFDSDSRGVGELMFHKRDGGAIAMLTTGRTVAAPNNDILNRHFITGLFSYEANGVMPTLGEAYKYAKNVYTTTEYNKMKFFLLGDPAIKLNYPISRFNIVKVNNTDVTDTLNKAQISPLMKFDIEARVMDGQGNLDTSFNGDATVTLYDKQDEYEFFAYGKNNPPRHLLYNRDKLTEVSGRVVNGVFRGQMIAPKAPSASGDDVLLRVYAHKDDSDYMVNGFTTQITMLPYDEQQAIQDNEAPVINAMFINDETSFTNGVAIAPESMLYITASDNEAINVQTASVDNGMVLDLDGGKPSYSDVMSYVTTSDGARVVNIEYPLNHLTEGIHSITFTVYDAMGNSSSRTISFMVGQQGQATLVADKWPAYNNEEVNFDIHTDLALSPEVTLRVTDATGNLVWTTTASSFPVSWDMKDMDGNRVPAGLYRYYGTFNNGINYGGTPISKLIVLDPVKTRIGYKNVAQ